MGVLINCRPRPDVLVGDLDDAIFAADFGDLVRDEGPSVYRDAKTFFQNTHPAQQLCQVVRAVFGRLNDKKEGGAVIRLSTGFGGGKTHTLMALWHLAQNVCNASMGTDLLPAAERPKKVTVIGVDASKAGLPVFATHRKIKVHSLWGEVLFVLGGEQALRDLGKADDPEGSPNDDQIKDAFPTGPVLLLIDELVIYMAKLSERGQGNLMGFINSLAAVVRNRPQTVFVVTDTKGQAAYAHQAETLARTLASQKLDELLARKVSDFDPIGNEAARVIVRRLFEHVDPAASQAVSATYRELYKRVAEANPNLMPPSAAGADYAKKIVECYPFHPRLLATTHDRLGPLPNFHMSRGVLRLFARIIRDVWEAKADHELITAGEVSFSSPRIQADLLQRTNRDPFKAAVSADVEGHARELDGGAAGGIHRRVASALLLESLPLQINSGLDSTELTLAVLRPEEAGPEPSEALDKLVGVCWHTYPMPGGRGWQFRYEPNIIKQIEERKSQIPLQDAEERVCLMAQEYFSGPTYKVANWPESPKQVSETAELQLVLCDSEKLAKAVCNYADDTDPKAPIPRRFRNAVLAVTADNSALTRAVDCAQRLLAAEAIGREHKEGEAGKLIREQLHRAKPGMEKEFRLATYRAFSKLVLAGDVVSGLEEKYQVSEEQMLQRPQGQACIKRFIEDKNLVYLPDQVLDADLFVTKVLPGATPLSNMPDVYTAKAVHERFLAAPGLRLIPDKTVVRRTVEKSVAEGKVVLRLPNGKTYDQKGCVEGPDEWRRRVLGATPGTFDLDDQVLMTRAGTAIAGEWIKEVTPGAGSGRVGERPGEWPPPPPPPGTVTADDWGKVVEAAQTRPLLELRLIAHKPADAQPMISQVQPVGADTLSLSITTGGNLKDGGTMNFAASDVKPTHPAKPMQTAQTVFNSLQEGSDFEAVFKLGFGAAGRTGMAHALQVLCDNVPEDIKVSAKFGKPVGGSE